MNSALFSFKTIAFLAEAELHVSGWQVPLLLTADEFLQRYARKFRTPVLTCVQDDNIFSYSFLNLSS